MTPTGPSCLETGPCIHPALARCLEALLIHARGLHGGGLEAWVRTQRLEPVLYGVGGAVDRFLSEPFLAECRQAYMNMLGRSHLFLGHAERIQAVLEAGGVASRAWRGAVYGRDLYGDAGLRCYADLDILVGPADRQRARRVLTGAGYRMRSGALPPWFLARHHLHWPMTSPDGRVPVDVHWAVDHPYAIGPLVPADVFLDARNAAANLLLAALHAEKESRLRMCADEPGLRDRLLRIGPVWPWLDLALMFESAVEAGAEGEVDRFAEAHEAGALMRRARAVVSRWFGVAGCGEFVFTKGSAGRRSATGHGWSIRLARGLGCRADVLLDWTDYLRAPVTGPERIIRWLRILRLACDAALCGAIACGKRLCTRRRTSVADSTPSSRTRVPKR